MKPDVMHPFAKWFIFVAGVLAIAVLTPTLALVVAATSLGLSAMGMVHFIVQLAGDYESMKSAAEEYSYVAAAISVLFAIASLISRIRCLIRERTLPDALHGARLVVIFLLTKHLSFQISLGAVIATFLILASQGAVVSNTTEQLVLSLFSIVSLHVDHSVFIFK